MSKVIEHKIDCDAEIAALEREIPGYAPLLRTIQAKIALAREGPGCRSTELAQLEKQLHDAREGLESAKEYLFNSYGSEAEPIALENQQRAEQQIAKLERDVAEQKAKISTSDTQDEQELARLNDEEYQLAQERQDKEKRLVELQNEKYAKYKAEGKRIYDLIARQCKEIVENEKVKRQAAIDAKLSLNSCVEYAYEKLRDYPDFLYDLEQEYGIQREDGATRIVRTGLAYLNSLILESQALETAPSLPGGYSILEVLALSDQEMLGHQWDGGTLGLKQRRALLAQFLEHRG